MKLALQTDEYPFSTRPTMPKVESWVESANEQDADFPLQNLPFGVFRRREAGATREDGGRDRRSGSRPRRNAERRLAR